MKRILNILFLALAAVTLQAQQPKRHKIALLTPLHLDTAFDAGNSYRFGTSFPKYLNPGLEFYLGAQAALDSLEKAGAPLEVHVMDTRSARTPLADRLRSAELRDVELFLASSNPSETRLLAEEALRRKVPFVSASLPNDAGVEGNPYYVVLNSTLRTHCEGLYKYIQKNNPGARVLLLTRSGAQETQVREYFQEAARSVNGTAVKIQAEDIGEEPDAARILPLLDSTRKNIVIAGSLDEGFAGKMAGALRMAGKTYELQVLGMPTWDGFNLRRPEFSGLELIYTTPFSYSRPNPLANRIAKAFQDKQNGRPTDMYFRGYETVLRFAQLLLESRADTASDLSRKLTTVFTPFDIQPVFLNRSQPTLDYFENKHLYFVKVLNGNRSQLP